MLLNNTVTNVVIIVLSINTTLLLTSIASIIGYMTSKPLFVETPTMGITTLLYITRKYKDRKSMKWGLFSYVILFMVSTHLCTLFVPIFHPIKPFYISDNASENFPIYRQFDVSTGRNAYETRKNSYVLDSVARDYCNLLSNCSVGNGAGIKPTTLVRLSDVPPKCNYVDMENNVWSEYCLSQQSNMFGVDVYSPAINIDNGPNLVVDLTPPICTFPYNNETQYCDYTTKYNISGKFNTTHDITTSLFYNLPAWTVKYTDHKNSSMTDYSTVDRLASIADFGTFGVSGIDNPIATLSGGWYIGNYVDIMHGSSNTSYVYSVTINRLVFQIDDTSINVTDISYMIGYDILPLVKNLNSTSYNYTNSLYDTVLTYNVSVDTNQMSGRAFFQVASSFYNSKYLVIDTWNSSVITYASYTNWDKYDPNVDHVKGDYIGRPSGNRTFVQPVVALWLNAAFPNSSSYIEFISEFNNWTTITDEAASLIIPLTTPSRTKGMVTGSTGYGQYGTTYKEITASNWSILDLSIVIIFCIINVLLLVYVNYTIPKYCKTPLWRTAINASDKFDLNFVAPTDGNRIALMSNDMVVTATATDYIGLSNGGYKLVQR
jgi:hypothetical protein